MKMRDGGENPNRSGDDIKTQGGRQTGRRERRRTQGGMRRKNRGFGEQQLREEKRTGRKTQWWMRRDSRRIERGKSFFFFFFLKCGVQFSLYFHSLSNTCHSSSLLKSRSLSSSQHHHPDITANQAGTQVHILVPLKY